jgi:DNA-binding MarR family transcriptional regulator
MAKTGALRDDVRPLDDAEMLAWRAYTETATDLAGALEAALVAHSLTMGDYQVLVYLSEADRGSMRMCDLAERLQLSPSGLTRRLDGLVRGGLVERVPSAVDRRVMLARLTPAGRTKLEAAYPDHLASVRRFVIDHLTRDDVEALGRIFTQIRNELDARCPRGAQ